ATSKQAELYMDMDQIGSLRPPRDLIEGIIPTRGVGYITGRDRSLKTFLALDICLHVAFMMPYWHRAGPDTTARDRRKVGFNHEGKIIFAAGEGVHSFSPRIQAWVQAQHVKSYGDPDIRTVDDLTSLRLKGCAKCDTEEDTFVGHVGHLEFANPDDISDNTVTLAPGYGELERKNLTIRRGTPNMFAGGEDYRYLLALARRERPDVIVLDTLALSSGAADQQSAKDMGMIHDRAAILAEASGGVVIIIAHTDKGDNDARGSSVIEDNSDFVIHCDRKDNDHVEVTVAKRKDAEDNWRFHLGVSTVDLGLGQSSLILKDYDGELPGYEDPEMAVLDNVIKDAENLVLRQKHNKIDAITLAAHLDDKMSPKTVGRRLDQLVGEGGLIRVEGGRGRGSKTYWYFPKDRIDHWAAMGHEVTGHEEQAP
ncbi:MAG: AAA family ATPase, partial [Kineosporiaceae bacterium]|nr:AAA family ATPase [Aeromicrobium sp.]